MKKLLDFLANISLPIWILVFFLSELLVATVITKLQLGFMPLLWWSIFYIISFILITIWSKQS